MYITYRTTENIFSPHFRLKINPVTGQPLVLVTELDLLLKYLTIFGNKVMRSVFQLKRKRGVIR